MRRQRTFLGSRYRSRLRSITPYAAGLLAVAALCADPISSIAASAPPHGVVAANLDIVVNSLDNVAGSVTATPAYSIGDFLTRATANNGDYDIQIGEDITDDIAGGVLMTSVRQNGRDNSHPLYPGTNYVTSHLGMSDTSITSGYWIPVCLTFPNSVSTSVIEYDANVAAAWFPYDKWIAGYAHYSVPANMNNTTLDVLRASPGLVLGTHFVDNGTANYTVNLTSLGINSQSDGVLLVLGAKNEDNYALSQANTNGTWTIFSKDSGTDGSSGERDPVAFVFVAKTNTSVISGKFLGDGTVTMFSGATPRFTVTNIDYGRWELKIKDLTPAHGVLIISPEGGLAGNQDNIVSYEINAAGDGWIIESRDLPAILMDDLSYSAPLETPGDGTEPVASFAFILGTTPGFTATPSENLQTTELGGTATFTVVLDTKPTANVTIGVSSSDTTEGAAAPSSLTFTPDNWDQPQSVTVTGVDDALEDGPVAYNVILGAAVSADFTYNGLTPPSVKVLNTDSEDGITVTPSGGLVTTEAGGAATFTVQLNTQPSADVVIGLSSSDTTEGAVSPASLTFTSGNWSAPQTITVTGVNDGVDDGDIEFTIVTAAAVSTDADYSGKEVLDVTVTNMDDDTAGIAVEPTTFSVMEGQTGTYTVALGSEPTANVVINVTSGNTAKGPASPATLTFTPQNYATPQTVTVTAVNDLVGGGNTTYAVTNTVTTTDTVYSAIEPADVAVTLQDNEATVTLPAGEVVYGIGMPGVGVAGRATVSDPYTTDYNAGTLTVALTSNGNADDRLEIRNVGSDVGQIGVNGTEVTYEGGVIGTFTGGTGTTPLVVTLNNSATPINVQELIHNITFRSVAATPSTAPRSVTVSLADVDGGVGAAVSTIRVGLVRVAEFQQGVDSGYGVYTGAADIELYQTQPDTAYPKGHSGNAIWMDYPGAGKTEASQALLRFDDIVGNSLGQIPSNAIIVQAELYLTIPSTVGNSSGHASPLYRMLIPWDAESATFNNVGNGFEGFLTNDVQARSVFESYLGLPTGITTGNGTLSVGVTADVTAWVNGSATNYGWLMPGWIGREDGTAMASSEFAAPTSRPRLRVYWVPAETDSASFRFGVNEYYNTFDTRLRADTPDVDGGSLTSIFVDWSGSTDHALIRFEDMLGSETNRIPFGSQIHFAVLELSSIVGNGPGDGGQFYAMLEPWDQYDTWNIRTNGITADGIEAAATPTTSAGNASLAPNVPATYNYFEVTSDVQAWANGVRANYGWAILPWPNGGDGWGFCTSEYADEAHRPRLRVFYSPGTGIFPPTMLSPVWSQGSVQIRFTGKPATAFSVQRVAGLPGSWVTVGTVTTDATGLGTYTDSNPPANAAFYRIAYP